MDFTTSPDFWFIGGPDGGAYSTAADLLRFVTALRKGELLNPELTDLATSGKVPMAPPANQTFTG